MYDQGMAMNRFPEQITLSGTEAIMVLATVEQAVWALDAAGRLDDAMDLNDVRVLILDKMTEGWTSG